jgi:L1 cell adhesion molecule like protein
MINEFKRKYKKDPSSNPRAIKRLKLACERAKRTLSSSTQTTIEIDAFFDGIDFVSNITRARFEELCMDIFKKTLESVETALRDAKLDKHCIDDIVLVGGSSRIPKIQQMLSEFFGGRELCKTLNPDECVAHGAATQAAALSGVQDEQIKDMLLLDVTPISLGIQTAHDVFAAVVPRNTTVPVRKSQLFSTFADNQDTVTIKVYEGERPLCKDNNLLGTFDLTGIPPAPRGVPRIEVTFDISADGIMAVSASEQTSGKKNDITIKADTGRLTKDQIERMLNEAEKYKEEDQKIKDRIEAQNKLETYLYNIKNTVIDSKETASKLSADDLDTVSSTVKDAMSWLDANTTASKDELEDKYKEVNDKLMPIITSMYNAANDASAPAADAGPKIDEVD